MRAWLALCLLGPVMAAAQTISLAHRVLPHPPVPLGALSLSPDGASLDSSNLQPVTGDGPWYQVILDHDGELIKATTKSCFIGSDLNLTLHLSLQDTPTALELDAASASSGACTSTSPPNFSAVHLHVKRPGLSQPPTLPHPVSLTTDGQAAPPAVEKSFLQKYWLAIVGVVLFLATQMGPDEPKPAAAK